MSLPYPVDATIAVVQLVLAAALVVVAPWLVLGRRTASPFGRTATDDVVVSVAFLALAVPVLAAARLYDAVSLLASVAIVAAVVQRGRGVRLRDAGRRAWRRVASTGLDRFEGGRRARRRRPSLRSLDPGPGRRAVVAGGVALGAVVAWLDLGEAIVHPGADLAGHGTRVQAIDDLALHHPWAHGVRHLGIESVLSAFGRVVSVDTPLLVRLAPGLVNVAIVAGVVWAAWRITDRAAAGLAAGAFAALAAHAPWWPIPREPATDVLAVLAATALVAPAIAVAVDVVRRRTPTWRALVAIGAVTALHPLVGALSAVAIVAGWLVATGMAGTGARRLPVAALAGTALGWLPIGLGLALGHAWDDGPYGVAASLGPAFREVTELPPDLHRPHLLLIAALVAAIVAIVLPQRVGGGPGPRLLGGVVLVAVVAVQPFRVGIEDPLGPGVAGLVATSVLALGVALLASLTARRTGLLLAVAAAIAVASLPLPAALDPHERIDDLAARIRQIDEHDAPFKWTIVAEPAALTEVPAAGFFIDAPSFLARYDPDTWRFDPEQPSLAVPTRHVYVFVPRVDDGATVANETGGAGNPGTEDLTTGIATGASSTALADWVERYEASHDDISVAWRTDDLVVFHIERTTEEEERATRRAEVAREERRQRAQHCRAVGDHLVFPTPRAFEECR